MKKPTKAALYAKIKELEDKLDESPRVYLKIGNFLYQGSFNDLLRLLETGFGRRLHDNIHMELEECT